MVAMKDDSATLDAMADMLVAGTAEHATDAIRKLGLTGEADERRLLRKWAEGKALLSSRARERKLSADRIAEVRRSYHEGYTAGLEHGRYVFEAEQRRIEADAEIRRQRETPPVETAFARSWLGRWLGRGARSA
jgi:hypothetical protein